MPTAPRFRSKRTLAPQRAPGLYLSTYEPELAASICRRIAAGESIAAICADPAMPTGKTVWNWARAHPEFAAMKAHALSVARAASLEAQAARDWERWMAPRKRTAWNAGLDGYSPEIVDPILAQLMGGDTLAVICAQPGMPSVGTVYNWLRRHPDFVARYRRAKAVAPDIMLQDACEHLPWLGERKSWPMLRRVMRETDKRSARKALKRYAPAKGPKALTVTMEEPDGTRRVIYGKDQA